MMQLNECFVKLLLPNKYIGTLQRLNLSIQQVAACKYTQTK